MIKCTRSQTQVSVCTSPYPVQQQSCPAPAWVSSGRAAVYSPLCFLYWSAWSPLQFWHPPKKISHLSKSIREALQRCVSLSVTPLFAIPYLVWPTRWHLSSACLSLYGLQSMSCRMTTLAEVRFMPRPPARVDSRKTKMSGSVLNSSISTIL